MRTLRPPTPVHYQGIWYGRLSGHWSATRPGGTGPDGVAGDFQGPRDQREDLQREAHGDPWPLTGGDERQGANNGAGQGRREAGRSLDGQFDLSPKPGPNDTISGIKGDAPHDLTKEEISGEALGEALGQARDQDRPDQGGDQGERPAECEGDERELKGVLLSGGGRPSSARTAGESEQGRDPAHQDRAGGEGPGGRVMALWESLKSLRSRMMAAESTEMVGRSDRLEATQSDNPLTSNMSPTRSTTPVFEELPQPSDTTSTTNHVCATCSTSSMARIFPGEAAYDRPSCMLSSMTRSSSTTTPSPLLEREIAETNHMVKKTVRPSLAKRLAVAAALSLTVMEPVKELMQTVGPAVDIMEIACSPESTLTGVFEKSGYQGERINFKTGYDLDTRSGTEKLGRRIRTCVPKLAWVSYRCTRVSNLQNLQWDIFLKRRGRDLQRCDEIVKSLEPVIASGNDVAWEWPTSAHEGWRSKPIRRLVQMMRRHGRTPYWVRIDGCAYGLRWQEQPVLKPWTILTTSRSLWLTLCRRCDRSHEHAECRGMAAQASSYYPLAMCKAVLKAMEHEWRHGKDSLERHVEVYLLENEQGMNGTLLGRCDEVRPDDPSGETTLPPGEDQQHVLALSRKRLDLGTAPTGKRLEAVKQLMLRVHRASGHAGMSNLVQLLKARGSPGWALELAANLECPECKEASQPRPRPPASLGEIPPIYEHVGTDVFEHEEPSGVKHKLILWRDRGSGLTMIDHLARYETGSWNPTTQHVIKSLSKWLMVYPMPKWIVADSARYYTSQAFMDYLNRSGVGLTVAPAEAHWLMGFEESAIGVAKKTVDRLIREGSNLEIPELYMMAAAAMNSHVGPSGFSAYQWAFGSGGGVLDDQQLLKGIDPRRAFDKLVKEREKAKIAYERERASDRFSKLANAVGRKAEQYRPGQLVMVWRQRVRPGKIKGAWTGPLRLVLMEGSTAWLVSGSTLIRAKVNQIRPTSQRETLDAALEGTAIYRVPVSLESLMRSFRGRYYMDISGDVPSEDLQRGDLSASTPLLEPPREAGKDSWSVKWHEGKRYLIRHHELPRLALFSPSRVAQCPVNLEELQGNRKTIVRPLHGGDEVTLHDTVDETRTLQDRWKGETWFELVSTSPAKKARVRREKGEKRKAEAGEPDGDGAEGQPDPDEEQPEPGGPSSSSTTTLQRALREKGPEMVDSMPVRGESGANRCPVPECDLHGGHPGHHQDRDGKTFMYDLYEGRQAPTGAEVPIDDASSSSTSSISEKLPLSEKQEFDLAMAKELSQVAISKALRNLSKQEELQVKPEQLMKMRWVLTRKSDGSAKARLVVLGFMAHNLTEVATTSPTMSKVGRNVILTLAAAYRFKLKAGDVTSAFLQTGISLEDEELNVLAPPELSAMFGSEAGDQRVLRVREAFYGLAHAPRKWWERCVQTMKDGQWHQLLGDKCCFALYEPGTGGNGQPPKLVGLAGLHVDDFLRRDFRVLCDP